MGCCLLLNATNELRPCQSAAMSGLADDSHGTTISLAIALLLTAKEAANRKPAYVSSLEHYLKRFAKGRENMMLSEFSTGVIEDWLKQFPSAYARQTWLNRISTLFSFGVRRDLCANNPCLKIERITVDRRAPKILTPEQVVSILAIQGPCATGARAYLVLGLFAGIRPDELLRLQWEDVNVETKTVTVNDAKTRRRRIVPLHDKAIALLAGVTFKRGPVSPSNSTVRRFKRVAALKLGWSAYPSDLLRHTFASYALALHQDAGKVATMMGNSSSILLSHYHEPVSQSDCQKFWAIGHTKYDPTALAAGMTNAQLLPSGEINRPNQLESHPRTEKKGSCAGEARDALDKPTGGDCV